MTARFTISLEHPTSSARGLAGVLALALAAGCASAGDKASASSPATGSADSTSATAYDTAGAPSSTVDEVVPSHYTLSGTLVVQRPDVVMDELELHLFDGDGLACIYRYRVDEVIDAEAPADEPLLTWWELLLSEPIADGAVCAGVPDEWSLFVGAGDYDSRLDPALVAADLPLADGYGLYVQEAEDAPVWITGLVATDSQLEGRKQPREDRLEDGDYALTTLFLLPWTPR